MKLTEGQKEKIYRFWQYFATFKIDAETFKNNLDLWLARFPDDASLDLTVNYQADSDLSLLIFGGDDRDGNSYINTTTADKKVDDNFAWHQTKLQLFINRNNISCSFGRFCEPESLETWNKRIDLFSWVRTDEFKLLIDFWIYHLPNDIDRKIFKKNLSKFIENSQSEEIEISSKNLETLINGGFDNKVSYQVANPYGVPVDFYSYQWPYAGILNNPITKINYKDGMFAVSARLNEGSSFTPLVNYKDGIYTVSAHSNESFTPLDKNYLQHLTNKKQRSAEAIFINQPFYTWPKDRPQNLEKNLRIEQYARICDVVNRLEREINSCWPFPNKDRKKIKAKALRELLINLHEHPYQSLAEQVDKIRKTYPDAVKGKFSHRVENLLNDLAPLQKTSKERLIF